MPVGQNEEIDEFMQRKRKSDLMTPIQNESVVQQVINKITEAIISGELKPGDKLPTEMELISSMSVSRNSLRSAIQTLRAYGVLEVRRPEGTFVCKSVSPQMLNPMLYSILLQNNESYKDLLGLRKIIDMGISKLIIAQGLTEEETANLERMYDEMVLLLRAEDYDIDAITEADLKFHAAMGCVTHNALAVMLNDFLLNLTAESRRRTIEKIFQEKNQEYLVQTHREYLDALERKPGTEIDQALEFSYFYWKDSYNW